MLQLSDSAELLQSARMRGCINCRWVEEYHVDGFRFDLASCLCRDPRGVPLSAPPLIRDIASDPVLSKVQLTPARSQKAFYLLLQLDLLVRHVSMHEPSKGKYQLRSQSRNV